MREEYLKQFYDYFSPKPSPFELKRFGGRRDGSYLLPDDLGGISACFSPGVENRKAFEDELLAVFGMRSHLADFSSDESSFSSPLDLRNQTFTKKWLGASRHDHTLTLDAWVEEREPRNSGDLLLQMDIEGAEYAVLEGVSLATLRRFRIIVVELHGIPKKLGLSTEPGRTAAQDQWQVGSQGLRFMEKIAPLFTVIHARPNNCSPVFWTGNPRVGIPEVMEFTLLRTDRIVARNDRALISPALPHPREIPSNCRSRPPVFLGPEWLVQRRPLRSYLAMLWAMCRYAAIAPVALVAKGRIRKKILDLLNS